MASDPLDLIALRTRANQHLLDTIRQFIPSAHWDKAVVCGALPIKAVCGDVWVNDDQTIFSLGFALLLEAEQGLVIHDRAAGFGDNIDDALRFALLPWVSTMFVTACHLYDPEGHPGHLASSVKRTFPGENGQNRVWEIVSSPSTSFSWGAESEKHPHQAPETLSDLESMLPALTHDEQMHWIKVFIAKSDGEMDIDCSLDNETSPSINRLFTNFSWPRGTDVKYIRQFHILKPTNNFAPQPEKRKIFGFLVKK